MNLQFLKNRLSLDVNYYRSRTTDQIIAPAREPGYAGFILQYINGGIVTNEGQEISLTGTPVRTASGFSWDVWRQLLPQHQPDVESLPSPLTVVYQSDAFMTDVHEGGAFPGRPISGIGATDFTRVTDPSSPAYGQVMVGADGLPQRANTELRELRRQPRPALHHPAHQHVHLQGPVVGFAASTFRVGGKSW